MASANDAAVAGGHACDKFHHTCAAAAARGTAAGAAGGFFPTVLVLFGSSSKSESDSDASPDEATLELVAKEDQDNNEDYNKNDEMTQIS